MEEVETKYINSKKIIGNVNYPEFKYLNLCKIKKNKIYYIFLSEKEKPKRINPRTNIFFPKSFKDSKLAKKLFRKINSVTDFGRHLTRRNTVLLD